MLVAEHIMMLVFGSFKGFCTCEEMHSHVVLAVVGSCAHVFKAKGLKNPKGS
jgi:predicted nucleic acid-binding Zn finger protein